MFLDKLQYSFQFCNKNTSSTIVYDQGVNRLRKFILVWLGASLVLIELLSTKIHLLVCIWYAWNNAGLFISKCYLKALHCIGSLNLFWFCFEVIIAFGRSELSQLRGRYHYLIIQVLIYLRKSTFYRRVEEWNWWWSRIIKFSYTIVYLCQDIATISELFLLLLSCTKGTLSVIICFAINI